jgi:hypothetical protein
MEINTLDNGRYTISLYSIDFVQNGRKSGYGTYFYANGDSYEGDWKHSSKEGFGVYTYKNGDFYKGRWVNDEQTDFGIFKWCNGDSFAGLWSNDDRNGPGLYQYAHGGRYEGNYVNDERDGIGSFIWVSIHRGEIVLEIEWLLVVSSADGCSISNTISIIRC